jgi:hypothetical protein
LITEGADCQDSEPDLESEGLLGVKYPSKLKQNTIQARVFSGDLCETQQEVLHKCAMEHGNKQSNYLTEAGGSHRSAIKNWQSTFRKSKLLNLTVKNKLRRMVGAVQSSISQQRGGTEKRVKEKSD